MHSFSSFPVILFSLSFVPQRNCFSRYTTLHGKTLLGHRVFGYILSFVSVFFVYNNHSMRSGVASTSHFGHPSPFFVFLSRSWSALHIPTDIFLHIARRLFISPFFREDWVGLDQDIRGPWMRKEEGEDRRKKQGRGEVTFFSACLAGEGQTIQMDWKRGIDLSLYKGGDGMYV
jgi:hypothetical protein